MVKAAQGIGRFSDIGVAVGLVAVVAMMVIPMPPWLLDLLLVANLAFSLTTLLATFYVRRALDIAAFPTILLVATLARLALNVSSTRLILLHGYAGQVIQQFGQFVVGGNAVVGFVVFLILVIIQFVVITRGAERVAEVAARFTLDAMPGKQMSIDADLNAGLIGEEEARARRAEIAREADFYGAMDGASKFVRGDAVAGMLITLVNVLGGFVIGMAQKGLTAAEALQRYTLLTVGDGLVTQIPALLMSTAAGIIVTRAASEGNLGSDMTGQLAREPRVLQIAAGVLAVLGLVPGLPALPFLLLAAAFGFVAWSMTRSPAPVPAEAPEEPARPQDGPEQLTELMRVDPLEIELGYGLLALADTGRDGNLLDRVAAIRRQMAAELGIVLPLIRVRDNVQLSPNDYVIRVRGVEAARGTLMPGHYLAMDPGGAEGGIDGIPTREPAFGLPALWIDESRREAAELAGYTVVDAGTVLATHLSRVVRLAAHQLLGRQDVKRLIDAVREHSPALVDELIPDHMKIGDVQKVLRNLLREGVPIRDLTTILEVLADRAPVTRDPDVLTEHVRQALAAQIAALLPVRDGRLEVLTLAPRVEQRLGESIKRGEDGTYLALPPGEAERLVRACTEACRRRLDAGEEPVILAPPLVRLHLRRLLEAALPDVPVVGYGEIPAGIEIRAVGVIGDED
ncbi:MAG: flagellar biosynthesis protein FlhA [Thermaerobacter sp.]|nr:flagellar biosynthesis protein FlhA [Bacillota bacterium]REJ37725.1 MAG: flagellar biosynthesis protein FlhA [Bacillota bacterium]